MGHVPTRHYRIAVQWFAFLMWGALIVSTHYPLDNWIARHIPVSLFLRMDPLVMTVINGGLRMGVTITLLAAFTMLFSIVLGRVFCGWICPLGAIFDGYGWILKRLRLKFEGPSPSWFRFKYYLLAAILIFAAFGAVSPLMGFDPIVLLTRTAASIIRPLVRKSDEVLIEAGMPLGTYGAFIDVLTLILFLTIMASTTKLSRIWCRTACPLGGYLAILSRHSILRRQTDGCVHCNICSNHCPTGAISFDNAEVYNESECIKCFACSQECPVDANYFTIKNPLPALDPSYAPVSLERRELLGTAAAVMVATPVLSLSSGESGSHKVLIRPPMSRKEHDFLASCIRCDECVLSCPTGILKPAELKHGVRSLWSPVMVASEGFCKEGCNACSQACPTDAILKYPIEEKYKYKAGTAIFESNRCISYTDGKFCSECIKVCPTNAITFEKGWEPDSPGDPKHKTGVSLLGSDQPAPEGKTPTRPVRIQFDACVGCGACEYECNKIVSEKPAMVLTSNGRALPTKF